MQKYMKDIETDMERFFEGLSEKEKRYDAAVEAKKLGYGGQTYIASVLGISARTIQRGLNELDFNDWPPTNRIRREGGGRKAYDKKRTVEYSAVGCTRNLYSRRPHERGLLLDTSDPKEHHPMTV